MTELESEVNDEKGEEMASEHDGEENIKKVAEEGLEEEEAEFKVLGEKKPVKRRKVLRTLPAWIRDGVCIENAGATEDESANLDKIDFLDNDLKEALKEIDGFTSLLPAQRHVIPAVLESASPSLLPPADICCAAPTGSGKTLAYLLPIFQLLRRRLLSKTLGAIVMVPTRGLAAQLTSVASKYGAKLGVKVAEVSANGGYDDDVAILICTPGRFSSALPHLNLANLRYLVLDECDRLLTDDRHGWLSLLNSAVVQHSAAAGVTRLPLGKLWSISELTSGTLPLQRLMFSATFSANPTWLAPLCLVRPRLFSVEPSSSLRPHLAAKAANNEDAPTGAPLPANLSEFMVECSSNNLKPLMLINLLLSSSLPDDCEVLKPALVFTNSSRNATRLTLLLNALDKSQGIRSSCFTGRFSPKRLRQLSRQLSEKKLDLIVCTDAAARGFDCPELASVICYDLPQHPRTYIHRAGRTARAGRPGSVFSIVTPTERRQWRELITGANRQKNVKNVKFVERDLEPFRSCFEKALEATAKKIKSKYHTKSKKNEANAQSNDGAV